VRSFAQDVHDLGGLRRLGAALCERGQPASE
jgi:hypothetical protein